MAADANSALSAELASASSDPSLSPETDALLRKADQHFNAGRQFYFQNDWTNAKREFDAAVNTLLDAPASTPDHRRIERHLDEICDLVYRFDVEKMSGSGDSADAETSFDKAPIDEVSHMTFPVDPSLAPKLESEVNQTTSAIPLELAEPVLSYVHFFSTDRGRSILLAGFKRAGRYRPLIQRIFAEEGIPQDLIYLAQAESGFLPRAVSRKSAAGVWQFIADTGARYDLVRTAKFDERLDPEKATRAAAKYLKFLYARYGDWYLAMAAYNCGEGAVDRAVERTGYADYWELLKRHALPRETSNYVPIIVAMTIMAKNAADYGLVNIESDQPVQYDSMQLTADTSLDLIADAAMQPVSVIRDLNPSLLGSVAPAGFQVHVPAGTAQTAQAALESVPAQNRNAWRLHHVETGDTLAAIARSYHLPAQRIVEVNHSTDTLAAGDVLLIPAVYHPEVVKHVARARSRRVVHARAGLHSAHVSATRRVAHTTTARGTRTAG
ncbi:MAG TPA: transglycosylase SLT domain-containing protein [Bryobacteraceae bacterium]|nr:transglycosylase SLT domain-containing protein [Bryobacteraceae bacterium]